MRGDDQQQNHIFNYVSPEARVRKDHPLHAIRIMVDEVLTQLSRRFDTMYARLGRPSIAPEKLLRAQLLQMISRRSLRIEYIDVAQEFLAFVVADAETAVSRSLQGTLDLYPRLRGLQSGAHAESVCSSGGVTRSRRLSSEASS
jgi:hypothetical protein